jgi:CRP/FNR family nitrogen fixation transcriptional regulator
MIINYNIDPQKKPRLLGVLGDLSQAKLSSSEIKYRKGVEIFGQAEPANYIYQVIEGAVRTHKLLSDGRRQIGAFHLPGDIFGLENDVLHRFTAEAIVRTTARLVKRESLEREAKSDPAILRTLISMTTDSLRRVEDHLLLLGRQSASERVAAFLLDMNGRQPSAGTLALPMSRRDIADYLGLTLETVSRAVNGYQRKGYLKTTGPMNRHIVVLNPTGLAEPDPTSLLLHPKHCATPTRPEAWSIIHFFGKKHSAFASSIQSAKVGSGWFGSMASFACLTEAIWSWTKCAASYWEGSMGIPEAPKGKATASSDKSSSANEQPSVSERRDVIQQYINDLRKAIKRLRDKLH